MGLNSFKKNTVIFIAFLFLFAILFVIFNPELFNPPHPGMTVIKINESFIPDGPIVHVVDEDFNEYPSLARVIRENSQQGYSRQNGTRIDYYIGLSWQEYNKILGSKFFKNPEVYFFNTRIIILNLVTGGQNQI